MIAATPISELPHDLILSPTNGQPVLIKVDPPIVESYGFHNPLDLCPHLLDCSHFMPPGFDAQLLNRDTLHRVTEFTHIGVRMHNGDVDESPKGNSHVATSS